MSFWFGKILGMNICKENASIPLTSYMSPRSWIAMAQSCQPDPTCSRSFRSTRSVSWRPERTSAFGKCPCCLVLSLKDQLETTTHGHDICKIFQLCPLLIFCTPGDVVSIQVHFKVKLPKASLTSGTAPFWYSGWIHLLLFLSILSL